MCICVFVWRFLNKFDWEFDELRRTQFINIHVAAPGLFRSLVFSDCVRMFVAKRPTNMYCAMTVCKTLFIVAAIIHSFIVLEKLMCVCVCTQLKQF